MPRPGRIERCARLFLFGLALVWCGAPILLVVSASFKPPNMIFEAPPSLFFRPTLENYELLWMHSRSFFRGLANSLIITIGTTFLTIVASSCAGYVYARYRNRFLNSSALWLLLVRMLPPIVITVPLFPIANILRLNDTHILLVLLYATFFVSLGTWIMRAFIAQIPRELDEAAEVDGAGMIQTLVRVLLPVAIPGLISVAIFVAVYAWNEYVFALIFTTREAKTAPVMIADMLDTIEGVQWGVIFAAATIQLLPVVALVVGLQRYIVAGLTAGAIKQ